mmetsp:Transcript_22585/g.25725  ORF Transcript_22585/g.25725 Transcript_22585/m.25725 type:complete len:359 (-) Transcript_22585:263-1339(-)
MQNSSCLPPNGRDQFHYFGSKNSVGQESCIGMNQNKTMPFTAKPVPFDDFLMNATTSNFDSQTVLVRILDSLRQRSVEASFDEKHSQIMCTTSQFLIYSIDLYVGSDPDSNTIVEVIRRQGCSLVFRREREAIINAANGLGADLTSKSFNRPIHTEIPPELLSLCKPSIVSDLECILDKSVDQLYSGTRKTQLFTLQHLADMTAPEKINSGSATKMTKLIIDGNTLIRDLIVDIVSRCVKQAGDELSEQILNSCLSILSNSMTLVKINYVDHKAQVQRFVETLVPSLVDNVRSCNGTHNAYLALKCLSHLIGSTSLECHEINEKELFDAIKCAEECGRKKHLKLETEAISVLRILGCH